MSVIDDYLEKVPTPEKEALEKIRAVVKKELPDSEEVISYGMPGFKYKGKYLLGFAAFKDHLSLFPTSEPVEVLKEKLNDFVTSKGTLQFTIDKPIPEVLIKEIIDNRKQRISKS